ncbi:MAG TPA: hypothetical protein VKB19_04130 [Pedobacter sp.]|nr:hypothetical protein [Pedobacter sp.]
MQIKQRISQVIYVLLVLMLNYSGFFMIVVTAMAPIAAGESPASMLITKYSILLVIFAFLTTAVAFLSFMFRHDMGYPDKAIWKVALIQMIIFVLMIPTLIILQ